MKNLIFLFVSFFFFFFSNSLLATQPKEQKSPQVALAETIFFEADSNVIKPGYLLALKQVGELMLNEPDKKVQLDAYLDTNMFREKKSTQESLWSHAEAVYQFMVKIGIRPSAIHQTHHQNEDSRKVIITVSD